MSKKKTSMEKSLLTWIEDAFVSLNNGEAKGFSLKLDMTLYFMYAQRIITRVTFERIRTALGFYGNWSYLMKNPDNTYSCFVEKHLFDTFNLEELPVWLMERLMEDELIMLKSGTRETNIEGLKNLLGKVTIPLLWNLFYIELRENAEDFVFTPSNIYWVKENVSGSCSLYKIPYKRDFSDCVHLTDSICIFDGIKTEIEYCPASSSVYAPIHGIDAFLVINDIAHEEEIIYDADLVKVSLQGKVYYTDRQGNLKFLYRKRKYVIGNYEHMGEYLIDSYGTVMVSPVRFSYDFFKPFILNDDGTVACADYFTCKNTLWKMIIDSSKNENFYKMSNGLYKELILREIYKVPYPFSVAGIKRRLDELRDYTVLSQVAFTPLRFVLGLLESYGISSGKCLIDILYVLRKYQLLYERADKISGFFSMNFYREFQDVNLRELLNNNPEKILGHLNRISEDDIRDIDRMQNEMRDFFRYEKGRVIGYFDVKRNKLLLDKTEVCNGIVVDNLIMKKDNPHKYKGEIFFDRKENCYVAVWEKNDSFPFEDELKFLTGVDEFVIGESWESKLLDDDYKGDNAELFEIDEDEDSMWNDVMPTLAKETNRLSIEELLARFDEKLAELENEEGE